MGADSNHPLQPGQIYKDEGLDEEFIIESLPDAADPENIVDVVYETKGELRHKMERIQEDDEFTFVGDRDTLVERAGFGFEASTRASTDELIKKWKDEGGF